MGRLKSTWKLHRKLGSCFVHSQHWEPVFSGIWRPENCFWISRQAWASCRPDSASCMGADRGRDRLSCLLPLQPRPDPAWGILTGGHCGFSLLVATCSETIQAPVGSVQGCLEASRVPPAPEAGSLAYQPLPHIQHNSRPAPVHSWPLNSCD